MKDCPRKKLEKLALIQWNAEIPNGLTTDEFLDRSTLEEIENISYAGGSIDTAINNFSNSFGLTPEQKDDFIAYINGEKDSFDLDVNMSKEELYDDVMNNVFNVHNAWVVSNPTKFDRAGREEQTFQHTKSQYIGFDELSLDLLFVHPIYEAAGIELDTNEMKSWFNNTVEQLFDKDGIHTVSDLRSAVTAHQRSEEWAGYSQEQKNKLESYKMTSKMLEQIMQRLPPQQLDTFIQSYDKTTAAFAYRAKNDGLVPTKKYEPAKPIENYRGEIKSPLRRTIYEDAIAYGGMTPKEALDYAQTAPMETLKDTSIIKDSMYTAYDKLVNNPELSLSKATKEGFAEHCFGTREDSPLNLSFMSKESASRLIVNILDDIHDKWVADNARKFNAERREFRTYQHMDTELIGWEEVSKDLMCGVSVFEAAKLNFDEESLKRAYGELVQEYAQQYEIHDMESFKATLIEQSTDKEWDGYSDQQKEQLRSLQGLHRTMEGVLQRFDDDQLKALIENTDDPKFKEECMRVLHDNLGPEPGYAYYGLGEQNKYDTQGQDGKEELTEDNLEI